MSLRICLNLNDYQLKIHRYSYRSTYVNLTVTTNQEPTIYLHPEPHGLHPTIHVRPESSTTVSVCTCYSSREAKSQCPQHACHPTLRSYRELGWEGRCKGKPTRCGLRGFSSSLTWVRHSLKLAGRRCPQLAKFREHHLWSPALQSLREDTSVRNLRENTERHCPQ